MGLTNAYLVTTKNLEAFLNAIVSARAPERFTNKFLNELEFTSSNDRLFIRLLKALGFVDESGVPQPRYFEFLDQSRSKVVLAHAIREAYEDLFRVNQNAHQLSADDVKNKLRTLTQGQKSDNVLGWMANTFRALCDLADWDAPEHASEMPPDTDLASANEAEPAHDGQQEGRFETLGRRQPAQLHYNIQIHLPESRDPAVFEAIFRSLKQHIL